MVDMAERKVPFILDEYYHVYNRGNSKQNIYRHESDYQRFQQLLHLSNGVEPFKIRELRDQSAYEIQVGERLVAIAAYCLMPNHFHILLKPLVETGVSLFMKKLSTGYSMYFNQKYERTGGLFEGRFKAQYVESDQHLKYLLSYIHLNPVKLIQPDWKERGIADARKAHHYLSGYSFSSHTDYISTGPTCGDLPIKRKEAVILQKGEFPRYLDSVDGMEKELMEWLTYSEK